MISSFDSADKKLYTTRATSTNPGAIVLLLDQSGSMSETFMESKLSKAEDLADAANEFIFTLLLRATRENGVRDWFHVCVIEYGAEEGRADSIWREQFQRLSEVARNHIGEKVILPGSDFLGRVTEKELRIPIWFKPISNCDTPMCAALKLAKVSLNDWIGRHHNASPPIVINITGCEATDGDPEPIALDLTNLATSDGHVLMFNDYYTQGGSVKIVFPRDDSFPDLLIGDVENAKKLFRMSSFLPLGLFDPLGRGSTLGSQASEASRGLMVNSDLSPILNPLTRY